MIMGIGVAGTECPEGMPLSANWNGLHLPEFKGTPMETFAFFSMVPVPEHPMTTQLFSVLVLAFGIGHFFSRLYSIALAFHCSGDTPVAFLKARENALALR